jgi:hypothetical protein
METSVGGLFALEVAEPLQSATEGLVPRIEEGAKGRTESLKP